jgi:hypothetical protein
LDRSKLWSFSYLDFRYRNLALEGQAEASPGTRSSA